jgi:hypothetical protein
MRILLKLLQENLYRNNKLLGQSKINSLEEWISELTLSASYFVNGCNKTDIESNKIVCISGIFASCTFFPGNM